MRGEQHVAEREVVAQGTDIDLQLLYFTSTSLSSDGRTLVAIGERDGQPNLYKVDIASGAYEALTHNTDGWLRSYVYFDGSPYRGLGKASVSFDAERGVLYYIDGRAVRAVGLDGSARTLATLPDDQVTGFTHVSADGKLLCVPTTDEAAFTEDAQWGDPHHGIDARVQRLGLNSYLRVFSTETGDSVACEAVPSAWVTHVQFAPNDPSLILYNHEWPSDCGVRRIWSWDGQRHLALRSEGAGRDRSDWTCHEMWQRDGGTVIYHGLYAGGGAYIGRVAANGRDPVELRLPEGWSRYGHFTVGSQPSILVTDGYYKADETDTQRVSPWISRLDVDWESGAIRWRVLGRSDSNWDSQDSHPHPILDADDRYVYFTSNCEGRRAIYRLPADPAAPVADVMV
jgi:hypothetical protein